MALFVLTAVLAAGVTTFFCPLAAQADPSPVVLGEPLLLSPAGGAVPDVAVDGSGRAHVVWRGLDAFVYYARVDPPNVIAVSATRIYDTTTTNFPRVAADAAGDAHIVTTTTGLDPNLLYMKVSNGARVALKSVTMFTLGVWDDIDYYTPSIDIDPLTGRPVIAAEVQLAWHYDSYPYEIDQYNLEISVMALDANGDSDRATRWSAYYLRNNPAPVYRARKPEVAVDSQGRAHCVWSHTDPGWSGPGIGYATAGATTWTQLCNAFNADTASGGPEIARGEDGTVEVVWSDSANRVVRQQIDHDGMVTLDDTVVSGPDAKASRPDIAAAAGVVFCSWADAREGATSDIHFSADGFRDTNISDSSGTAANHAIAARSSTSAVFAWQDTRNGSSQVFLRTAARRNPLLFIPGVLGSVLCRDGDGEQLWPTIRTADAEALNLRNNPPTSITATAVLREYRPVPWLPFTVQGYKRFLEHLTGAGYVEFDLAGDPGRMTSDYLLTQGPDFMPTLFTFPYDWRKSNTEHVAELHAYIRRIRTLHGGAKVDIVAHSMGGLLARRYLLEHDTGEVGKVVTVGSPFWGAPEAVYRMFTGGGTIFPLEFWKKDPLIATWKSCPALHELLPSDSYLLNSGAAVFAEEGIDLNRNGRDEETYDSAAFRRLVDQWSAPDHASENNVDFHQGRQDDWSADQGPARYLHIVGDKFRTVGGKVRNDTPVQVVAVSRTLLDRLLRPWKRDGFEVRTGPGDGTVPLLSANRPPPFLAPKTEPPAVFPGGDAVGHLELLANPGVWNRMHAFLEDLVAPASPEPVPTGPDPAPPDDVTTRRILITGCGYARVTDAAGNENTRFGDMGVLGVPGVRISYGGSEPWVEIECDSTAVLNIEGEASAEALEIECVERDPDGTPVALLRHRFLPGGSTWRLRVEPSAAPELRVDADDDGNYAQDEVVAPTHNAAGAAADTTPPTLTMSLSPQDGNIVVRLTAEDAGQPAPVVRYSIDGGAARDCSSALDFPATSGAVLKAYAEDALGNTSGLIETVIAPTLAATRDSAGTVKIAWPVAEAYVLEEALTLDGPWAETPAAIVRSAGTESVSIPAASAPRKFFRLRSQAVTR